MNKKVVSFSLWGNQPKYIVGFVRNLALIEKWYPGWVPYVYIHADTLEANRYLPLLVDNMGGKLIYMPSLEHVGSEQTPMNPLCWRFLVADDPDVELFIVRDADSRIGEREAVAVHNWVNSGLICHTMRDHNAHGRPMHGGMIGARWRNHNWEAPHLFTLYKGWYETKGKDYTQPDPDQQFLCDAIWPWIKVSAMQHDSVYRQHFPGALPFPTRRLWPRFVGEVWEVNPDGTEFPRVGDFEQISKDKE